MNVADLLRNLINIDGMLLVFECNKTGRVREHYINEQEFSKTELGLNASLLYNTAKEMCEQIGLQEPDYNLIHAPGYNILTIIGQESLIFAVCQDTVKLDSIFILINRCLFCI